MAKKICDYCGTEYEDTMERCPLCGTENDDRQEAEPQEELRPVRRERRTSGGQRAASEDKIPKWLSILICVILGIAVVIGALYAMYALGMLSPKKEEGEQPNLSLPIDDVQTAPSNSQNPDESGEGDTDVTTPKEIACTGITVSPASVRMEEAGVSVSLTAVVLPVGCTDPVTWTSSDESVCTVDDAGVITSVSGGTAAVTAACGTYRAAVNVECDFSNTQENNASLDLVDFTLFKTGEQATIHVLDAPENAAVTWTSSNTGVCTVSNGTVTAVKSGTAAVTADVNGKKLECIVRCNIEGSVVATDDNAEVVGGHALTYQDVTLKVGESFEISVVDGVSGGWNVSDGSVISVDANGNVTALSSGTAKVYTTVAGERLECIVRVP